MSDVPRKGQRCPRARPAASAPADHNVAQLPWTRLAFCTGTSWDTLPSHAYPPLSYSVLLYHYSTDAHCCVLLLHYVRITGTHTHPAGAMVGSSIRSCCGCAEAIYAGGAALLGARGRSWGGRDSHGAGGNSAGADQVKQVLRTSFADVLLRLRLRPCPPTGKNRKFCHRRLYYFIISEGKSSCGGL